MIEAYIRPIEGINWQFGSSPWKSEGKHCRPHLQQSMAASEMSCFHASIDSLQSRTSQSHICSGKRRILLQLASCMRKLYTFSIYIAAQSQNRPRGRILAILSSTRSRMGVTQIKSTNITQCHQSVARIRNYS